MKGLDDEASAGFRCAVSEPRLPQRDALAALVAHLDEALDAALIATAARRDAFAQPQRLAGDALVGARLLRHLDGDDRLRPRLEARIAFVVLAQPAAVEPQRAARQALE